jgi:hypothetical protein
MGRRVLHTKEHLCSIRVQVRALGGGVVEGWGGGKGGGSGLEAIVGVLGRAAQLIQQKG